MDMEMLVDMVMRMPDRDRVDFVEKLVEKNSNRAKEIAKMINIEIRDQTIPFMD